MSQPSPHAFLVNGEVFFDPHERQRDILQKLAGRVMRGEGPSKYFLRGNRGGGKSYMIRRGLLHGLAMALDGLRYVVVRRNYPDLEMNHLQYLKDEMRVLRGDENGFNETKRQVTYLNGSKGFYRQCEEAGDVEKIVGSEAAILFVDEAPQIEWEYLTTMLPSLRVAKGAGGSQPYWTLALFSGNPMGASIEELDQYFRVDDAEPTEDALYQPEDWEHIPIHLKDNPSLDPDEYMKQLGPIPPQFRAAWIDGVRMESRTLFDVRKVIDRRLLTHLGEDERGQPLPDTWLGKPYHYIQELPKLSGVLVLKVPWIVVYRNYDHGYFPDPAVCLWVAVYGRRLVAFHEETWFRKIAEDCATAMKETHGELVGEIPCAMTYIDPDLDIQDGKDVITVRDKLESAGVPCEPSINNRVMYADAIHSLLGEEVEPGVPRFQIYEPGCPMLAKYLPKMRWDEKNPRKMADHKFDHWIVALAYFAISSGVLSITAESRESQEPIWQRWEREDRERRRGSMRA